MSATTTPERKPVGGVDYPRNWHEFLEFFSTEERCLQYLARLRWPDGFRCPHCGHDQYWLRADGRYLCCECRHKTSVTAGTLFEGTRIGLTSWFAAAWYVVNQTSGVSALGIQRVLGFGSYETAWAWLHKLRRAMAPTSGKLRGVVEVDETYVGGHEKGVTGRETRTKAIVVVAVERHGEAPRLSAGRVRMKRIPASSKEFLIPFIQANIEPGSLIVTDGWGSYKCLPKHGYLHEPHNVSKSGKQAHELLPEVHRIASLLKRWLLGTHQGSVRPEHLDFYLDEFAFRFNRRKASHRGLLFHSLVQQAVRTGPQPYTSLLSKNARRRRKRKQKRARGLRADGVVGARKNRRHAGRVKRPGGGRTRLADDAHRRRNAPVAGRRGG